MQEDTTAPSPGLPSWFSRYRPTRRREFTFGKATDREFSTSTPCLKIFEDDEKRLQKSDNPFDLAHYAGMQAWKQRGSDTRKLDYMKLLLAELDRRGWSHEAKMALLWFIEGIMHIADEDVWEDGGQMHAA